MGTIASQITSLTIDYSTVYSGADQRKHQSSKSLAFVRWITMASNAENVSIWWRHHEHSNYATILLGNSRKEATVQDVRSAKSNSTRQIWGIWKLRPAYSPETPNLGQNRWCFVPCDLEILWMTLENNRAPLLCCFKLCATFHSHRWIQTGVAVRKRPIWVIFYDF